MRSLGFALSASMHNTREETMKLKYRVCRALLTGALLVMGITTGFSASAADKNPCSQDIATFCKDVGPGWGAIRECLERNESRLSDSCKTYEARMERPRVESREVAEQVRRIRLECRGDAGKFCGSVGSDVDKLMTCLKGHSGELSIPCREAVEAAKGGEEERTTK
jgi:hypothetical protein